jgi:hypothetical protein
MHINMTETLITKIRELIGIPGQLTDIRQSIDQQTEAIRTTNERANHQHEPHNIRAEISFAEHTECKQKADSNRHYGIQKSLRNWTAAAFIAAATYAGIAAFQLCEMKKAAKASENQFLVQNRPYVWVKAEPGTTAGIIFANGGANVNNIWINAVAKNVGRTPAVEVRMTRSFFAVDYKEVAEKRAKEFVPDYRNLPTFAVSSDTAATIAGETVPHVTDKQLAMIREDGTWAIYMFGGIQYRDTFSPKEALPYETPYCFLYTKYGLFADCNFTKPIK